MLQLSGRRARAADIPRRPVKLAQTKMSSDSDVQEVLAWAQENRPGETFPLFLAVRKGQPNRQPAKEVFFLGIAVRSQANSARLLLLKKDGNNFVLSSKRSTNLSDVLGIDVQVESVGGYAFMVDAAGQKPACWVARTSADRLHFAVTTASTYLTLFGKVLPVLGVEEKELQLWAPSGSNAADAAGDDEMPATAAAGEEETPTRHAGSDGQIFEMLSAAVQGNGGEGSGGIAAMRERLEEELLLLQDANLHAMIASGDLIHSSITRVRQVRHYRSSNPNFQLLSIIAAPDNRLDLPDNGGQVGL